MLILLAMSLFGFSYEDPEVVVEFSGGRGQYQVGIVEEDVPIGPYRLAVTDTLLYLLDQLNNRVLSYDAEDSFIREVKTPFRPADMAVDGSGRIWLLENRSQPAEVAILASGKEVKRIRVKYEANQPITGLVIHPPDSLVFISGKNLYFLNPPADIDGILKSEPSIKAYELKKMELAEIDSLPGSACGFTPVGVKIGTPTKTTETLVGYDKTRIWIGLEQYIQDKSGSFVMRAIVIREGGKGVEMVDVPSNYYSYDAGRRNVAIDSQGNVYIFSSTQDGKSNILRWRVRL